MRIRSTIIVTSLLAFAALAGCSDAPPSGDLPAGAPAIDWSAEASAMFQEEVRNAPEESGPLYDLLCEPEDATGTAECQDASSYVNVMLHTAPEPDNNGYTAHWIGGAEEPVELDIGALELSDGMYEVERTFDGENYEGHFESIVVRMGALTVGSGPAGGGAIEINPEFTTASATASYSGKTLTIDASGLPAASTGWLVASPDGADEGASVEHLEEFEVVEGANEYTADRNIDEYDEFHIHIGGSKINIYSTQIS